MVSYGSIPRRCDRAKAYLYFKDWTDRLFECKNAKRKQDVARVLLAVGLTIKLLLFDRGCYSTALIRCLEDCGFKCIIYIPWYVGLISLVFAGFKSFGMFEVGVLMERKV